MAKITEIYMTKYTPEHNYITIARKNMPEKVYFDVKRTSVERLFKLLGSTTIRTIYVSSFRTSIVWDFEKCPDYDDGRIVV